MKRNHFLMVLGAAAIWGSASVKAATSTAQLQYDQQKAACMSGKSNQDRATCLKEAGAALDETKRGNLNDADSKFRQNQLDRCKALAGSEQADCMARMKGSGTVSGSVGGGGVLREKKTTTVTNPGGVTVAPAAVPPMAPPSAAGPN